MGYLKELAKRSVLSLGLLVSPRLEGYNSAIAEVAPEEDPAPSSWVSDGELTIESRASFNDKTTSNSHMRYKSADRKVDVAVDYNAHSDDNDFGVGAMKLKLNDHIDFFGYKDLNEAEKEEYGIVVKPNDNWTGIMGIGKNSELTRYLGLDWQQNPLGSKDNIGVGVEGIDSENEDRIGGYGFVKINGMWLSYGDFKFARTMIIGYPNKDGPSFRYFRFDGDDGFELNQVIVTPNSIGLQDIYFRSPLQSSATSEWESVSLRDTNPYRFRAGDLNQRGKEWVFGVSHKRKPGLFEKVDTELVKYLDDTHFILGGYGLDLRGEGHILKAGFGRTTGSYYNMKKGDPINYRVTVSYNSDTGEFMPMFWAMRRF